jgi:hypothetical protein
MSGRKRLFAYALLALCAGSLNTKNCAAQEMATVEKYISQNNFEKNPGAMQFVMLRCASLFLLVGGHFQESPDLQTKTIGKRYSERGNRFLKLSEEVAKPFDQEFALGQANRMIEAYKERWLRQKALSGNFSDDPIIRSDMQVCSSLSK